MASPRFFRGHSSASPRLRLLITLVSRITSISHYDRINESLSIFPQALAVNTSWDLLCPSLLHSTLPDPCYRGLLLWGHVGLFVPRQLQ